MRGVGIALLLCSATAAADSNDIDLAKLGTKVTDASGNVTYVGSPGEFRSLASQLGTVLAPDLLTPADTIGWDGFQLAVDYANTTIDQSAAYWRVLEGPVPSAMNTVGFFARKGLWLPLPSFEVGAGAVHLVDSHLWTAQLYAKFALVEGYHDLPLPSLAVRGGVSRLMNQRDLDLTIASLDVSISKHVGIGGTWRLDPYAGYDLLMIIPHSEVIDPVPNVDPLQPGNQGAQGQNFVFADQDTIFRNKIFLGAKLEYYIFTIALEGAITLAGTSTDERQNAPAACVPMSTTSFCNAQDAAKLQRTLALTVGLDL